MEDYNYDLILARMLSRISDSIDKREGSVIYDALAPAAYELADFYQALYAAYEDTFLYTASGTALDNRCEELGLSRNSAVKAVRKGTFSDPQGAAMDIALGSRFSVMEPGEGMNFMAVEKMAAGVYRMEAESAGAAGNDYQGDLLMISHIESLGQAVLTDILIPGEDEEDDDTLRIRAASYLRNEAVNGNAGQYLQWAAEFDGIGQVKVFPCWEGGNTVKISILNSLNQVASDTLLESFQEYLDPNGEGLGNGVAPIGAKVTVSTASTKDIVVSATITLANGYDESQAECEAQVALETFFSANAYARSQVNYIEIGAVLLSCASVEAVRNLTVNETQGDIALGDEEIPVLGAFAITVGVIV